MTLDRPIGEQVQVAADGEDLWVLDASEGRLHVFDARGKWKKELKGAESNVPIGEVTNMAASSGWLGLVEGEDRILLLSKDGRVKRLRVPHDWYPSVGFFFTPYRLFFTYLSWMGPGRELDRDPRGRYATLLSTDWVGKNPKEYESVQAGTAAAKAAGLWNAYSNCAEWRGHGWVVARSLPFQLYLFSAKGELLRRYPERPPSGLPPLPTDSKEHTLNLLATDRVIGLVPAGDYLGVVWQRRTGGKNHVEIEWRDGRWEPMGRHEVAFPKMLTQWDILTVAAEQEGRRVVLLLYSMQGFYASRTSLYEWPFLASEERMATAR
ncbi:MAG: hypothetical protein ACOYXN_12915 [Acidobacteriota bacterium]